MEKAEVVATKVEATEEKGVVAVAGAAATAATQETPRLGGALPDRAAAATDASPPAATVTTMAARENDEETRPAGARYETDECWAAAVAVTLAACAATVSQTARHGNKLLRQLNDKEWVRLHAANLVSDVCSEWKSMPNDAIRAFVKVAESVVLTDEGGTLSDFVSYGKWRPALERGIAALVFDKHPYGGVGHWTAMVKHGGKWWHVDDTLRTRAGPEVTAKACYWVFFSEDQPRRRGGAQPPPAAPMSQKQTGGAHQEAADTTEPERTVAVPLGRSKRLSVDAELEQTFALSDMQRHNMLRANLPSPGSLRAVLLPEPCSRRQHRFAYVNEVWNAAYVRVHAAADVRRRAGGADSKKKQQVWKTVPTSPQTTARQKAAAAAAECAKGAKAAAKAAKQRAAAAPRAVQSPPAAVTEKASAPTAVARKTTQKAAAATTPPPTRPAEKTAAADQHVKTRTVADKQSAEGRGSNNNQAARPATTSSTANPAASAPASGVTAPRANSPGRPRKNKNGAIATKYAADGRSPTNLSQRDCAIAAAMWMLVAIVQTPGVMQVDKPQRPTENHIAEAAWRALYERDDAAVDAVREATGQTLDGNGLRKLQEPTEMLIFLGDACTELGVRGEDMRYVHGDGKRTAPLAVDHDVLPGSLIVCLPTFDMGALTAKIMDIGHGVKARVEAVIMMTRPSFGEAEAARHYWTVIRQRDESQDKATEDNAFQRFDDGERSAVRKLEAMREGTPCVVLFRVVSVPTARVIGVPAARAVGAVAARVTARSAARTEEQKAGPMRSAAADISASAIIDGAATIEDSKRHQVQPTDVPLASRMQAKALTAMRVHRQWMKADMVVTGLSKRVRERHRRLLMDFRAWITPETAEMPLDDALVQFISKTRHHGKRNKAWSESSTLRNMTALAGAFTQLPVYTDCRASIDLGRSPTWKSALRGQEIKTKMAEPVNQAAMRYGDVKIAVEAAVAADDNEVAVAIMLTWLCAGRVGDATQFHCEDIEFAPIDQALRFQHVKILMRRGKTAKQADPHTVYSVVPPEWKATMDLYMEKRGKQQTLFTRATDRDWGKLSAAITAALRVAGEQFGQRALRRGALQTIAADPAVDLATLRTFSGHTNDATLLRYLNWGHESGKQAALAQTAARNLFPTDPYGARRAAATNNDDDDDDDADDDGALLIGGARNEIVDHDLMMSFLRASPTMGAPKSCYIAEAGEPALDRNEASIHCKYLPTTIGMEAVANLPGAPESRTGETFARVRRWVEDDSIYELHKVPMRGARGIPRANYTKKWIDDLEKNGVISRVAKEEIRGWTKVYAVPEPLKHRFRPIMHTKDINDACGRDTIEKWVFPSKATIAAAVHDGDYIIALDFSAYYHQFALAPEIGRRMCFGWNHKFYKLDRAAMGQRQMVDVANATTTRILDFEHRSKRVQSIIDNVSFIGNREDVIDDAWEFVQRCRTVLATLNEIDVRTATRGDVEKLVRQEADWGGVHINLVDKSVALMEKITRKTELSWSRRAHWQWRHFAAHVGLLFWAWGITDLPMSEFFPALRFISEVGKAATEALERVRADRGLPADAMPPNPFWHEHAKVWPSALPALERWTELVVRNAPRAVLEQRPPEVIFECDASKKGYAVGALNLVTGETLAFAEKWSPEMRRRFGDKLRESTTSENFGVTFSLIACHRKWPDATRFAGTNDNTVAVVSSRKRFNSKSWAINESLRIRDEIFSAQRFDVLMKPCAGLSNIADAGSRGIVFDELSGEDAQILRSRWGISDGSSTLASSD